MCCVLRAVCCVLYAATVAGEFEQIGALRLNGNLVALPSPLSSLQARR
jgi:hypothetical protein